MHILGFIIIVTGLLTAIYFSGPKNSPQQVDQPPTQSQAVALPVASPQDGRIRVKNLETGEIGTMEEWDFDPKKFQSLDSPVKSSNYDYEKAKTAGLSDEEILNYIATESPNGTVTIRNKATGEIRKIPKSQLANYISGSKSEPKVTQPTDKALKLAVYIYLASNGNQRQEILNKVVNGKNDVQLAITNLALMLDSKPEGLAIAERLVAEDQAKKKAQAKSDAELEYYHKELERLKRQNNSLSADLPNQIFSDTTQNKKPILPAQENIPKRNPFVGITQNINNSSTYNLNPPINQAQRDNLSEQVYSQPFLLNPYNYKQPIRYDVIGDSVYGNDGSRYDRIGNSIYGNDGTRYDIIGDSVYGNDGSRYDQIGDSIYKNDGTRYDAIGDTVYGSDGSRYDSIGSSIYFQPGF